MPRDIPVGNGQMLVAFDHHYQIRDIYFPHVGQENHAGGGACRFGVYGSLPQASKHRDRRRCRLYWSNEGWRITLNYLPHTLANDVTLEHPELEVRLKCCDVVDFHRPLLVRRIVVQNLSDRARTVRIFHHNDFHMFGTKVGDTAYFDPKLRMVVHYRGRRYLMTCFFRDGEQRIDEYATGYSGFHGAEGTWRDAEDGALGGNPIAQGAVDSTIGVHVPLAAAGEPGDKRTVYMVLGCGQTHEELIDIQQFLNRESPQGVIDRTIAYWRLWVEANEPDTVDLPESVVELYRRSLLILRTQINNSGAIIAANDSDIMQFARDTYSYLWPRDGALVAHAMDLAGHLDVARTFYSLCEKLLTPGGFFLHKYNPDGSRASSWHPWVAEGRPQLPIQEDETALVLWALWEHYARYRDVEFVRGLWIRLIQPAADFLDRFRDPGTNLPLPSYDLWEERWGVNAFTVATVYGGLMAGKNFAICFGDKARAKRYARSAEQMREAFCHYMWSDEHDRFLRRIVPLDHERTSRLMEQVLDGRDPSRSRIKCDPDYIERDEGIDSSLYGLFRFGLLDVHDPRIEKTMRQVEQRLWIKTPIGGMARYDHDTYHRATDDTHNVAGNPWFICTLWMAEWRIAKARSAEELRLAIPAFEWVVRHALSSGVLAEQVHPNTGVPLSVSPLTWSHAAVISGVLMYLEKLQWIEQCDACLQPRYRLRRGSRGDLDSDGERLRREGAECR